MSKLLQLVGLGLLPSLTERARLRVAEERATKLMEMLKEIEKRGG